MGNLRAFVLALVLIPAIAAAQPSAKDKQKASEKVKAAIAKSQAGEHNAAIELYLEAYKIIPQPLLHSNIGSEYQQMDKPVEALSYFCKYLDAEPDGSNAGYARAQAKLLYIKVAEVPDVSDADVCKPIVKKEPDPIKPPDPDPKSDPKPVAPAGPETKTPPLRWVGVGVGVIGAGMFGLGVFYGLKAKSISDDITNHDINDPWTGIKQMEADGESYETKQIIFMVGGGVALAAGVAIFILVKPKTVEQQQPGVVFTPVATPDSFGFAAAGRF